MPACNFKYGKKWFETCSVSATGKTACFRCFFMFRPATFTLAAVLLSVNATRFAHQIANIAD